MGYLSDVMEILESKLAWDDLEIFSERIERIILSERDKGVDKVRPEILAEGIYDCIIEGDWYEGDGFENEFDSYDKLLKSKQDDDDSEWEGQEDCELEETF